MPILPLPPSARLIQRLAARDLLPDRILRLADELTQLVQLFRHLLDAQPAAIGPPALGQAVRQAGVGALQQKVTTP